MEIPKSVVQSKAQALLADVSNRLKYTSLGARFYWFLLAAAIAYAAILGVSRLLGLIPNWFSPVTVDSSTLVVPLWVNPVIWVLSKTLLTLH